MSWENNYALETIKEVLNTKSSRFSLKENPEGFNKCVEHIGILIQDAYLLYKNESFATAAFIAISTIEEVAKTHIGMYITRDDNVKRGNDPLLNHKSKHAFGTVPSIKMGPRLNDAISDEMIDKIVKDAEMGDLGKLRESALYSDIGPDGIIIPSEIIDKKLSRALLLFAIECYDDSLVGYSNYTYKVAEITDKIFDEVKSDK